MGVDAVDATSARVERRRLLAHLASDVEAGADIIAFSAPAGAGKTTTLEQWQAARRLAGDVVVSVTQPRADSPGELWTVILSAIRATAAPSDAPAIARAVSRVVNGPSPSATGVPAHDLRRLRQPLWIMVDDAHHWSDDRSVQQLGRLLAAAQPAMRLAIGARYTPQGLLPKLIMEGSAREYRSADLAFDRDEARALLLTERVELDDADLDILLGRTDGWAAGLRLAALAISRHPDTSSFVEHFAGTERIVSDYLVSEVLSRLPPDLVDLMLDVSVPDQVNLDLARLLSGRPDAGAQLEELAGINALVQTSRDDPEWYELHPLLRTYLRAESRRRDNTRYVRQHTVATDWFERAGDIRHAIHHAVGAADWPRVESLIRAYCARVALSDGPDALRDILRTLPPSLQSSPSVAGAAALTALLDGNLPAARMDLDVLRESGHPADATRGLALQALLDLASARTRAVDRATIDAAVESLHLVAGEEPDLAVLGQSTAGLALAMIGDLDAARETARAIAQVARRRGLDFLLFQALGAQCAASAFRADFGSVRMWATEAIDLASHRGWDRHPRLAQFYQNIAAAEWQRFDDAAAAEYARSAVDVADADADPLSAAAARCIYDLIVVTPDTGLDLTTIGHLHTLNDLWPLLPPTTVALNACFELMVSLRAHESELAGDIIRRAGDAIPDAPDIQVFKAMRHLYQGREATARHDLEPVLTAEPACLTPWTQAIAWAVAAHLADAAGEPARAHDALLKALQLAEPSDLIRGLLEATPSVRQLLVRHRGRFGRYEAFVTELLAAAEAHRPSSGGTGLVLTEREIALLRDLPSLLSLREIADAHVVSINTVKSHLKSVYRKLGVASRREAVDVARELGMI